MRVTFEFIIFIWFEIGSFYERTVSIVELFHKTFNLTNQHPHRFVGFAGESY